jgi:hypothetical protein
MTAVVSLLASPVFAQTNLKVYPAELSLPFGVASGQIVTVDDYLLFIDADKPDTSFAARRSTLRTVSAATDRLTVESTAPLMDRSGSRSQFVFRLKNPEGAQTIQSWFNSAPSSQQTTGQPISGQQTGGSEPQLVTYQVRHDHLLGSCTGRFFMDEGRIVFESITDIEDSRRWALSDIKELKRDNPYTLKIEPFNGDTYRLSFLGQGLETKDFQSMVDRVTRARSR